MAESGSHRPELGMKTLQIELPDKAASELAALVEGGWFADEAEVVRAALVDFLGQHRPALMERFQQEDIRWALEHKGAEQQHEDCF